MSCTVFIKDKDLKPENIKKGVKIFKIVGTYEGDGGTVVLQDKTADSSTSSQVITYDADYDGLSSVTVNPYVLDSKTIDVSTVEQVVTSDADGLSSVTVNAAQLQNRTVDPSTVQVDVARTSNDYYGLRQVTINPVTSSIDSNIQPENIKKDVTILGVTGTLSSGSDWILDVKRGATTLDTDTGGLSDTDYGMYMLFSNSALTSVTLRNATIAGAYALNNTFYEVSSITSVSFPELTSIDAAYAMFYCFQASQTSNCTVSFPKLKSISGYYAMSYTFYYHVSGALNFPELTTIEGQQAMEGLCQGSNVTTISFPKLERITGYYAFDSAFAYCASLVSISMPNLKYKNGSDNVFNAIIAGSASPTLEATPEVFKYYSSDGEYFGGQNSTEFSDITLRIPTGYTYSNGWNNSGTTYICFNYLSDNAPDSTILDILQKLGSVSDYDQVQYTVVFKTRTVNDNMNSDYTTAYNKLIDAGWTITNLTINAA